MKEVIDKVKEVPMKSFQISISGIIVNTTIKDSERAKKLILNKVKNHVSKMNSLSSNDNIVITIEELPDVVIRVKQVKDEIS